MDKLKTDKQTFLTCLRGVKYLKAKYIHEATGLSPRRQQQLASILRKEGHPIGSGDNGYHICETAEEIDRHLAKEIKSMAERREGVKAMERIKDKMFRGQGVLC